MLSKIDVSEFYLITGVTLLVRSGLYYKYIISNKNSDSFDVAMGSICLSVGIAAIYYFFKIKIQRRFFSYHFKVTKISNNLDNEAYYRIVGSKDKNIYFPLNEFFAIKMGIVDERISEYSLLVFPTEENAKMQFIEFKKMINQLNNRWEDLS